MVLETKFDVGQTVWLMHNDKIVCSRIYDIEIFTHANNAKNEFEKLLYRVELQGEYNYIDVKEHVLFATKEELLKALNNSIINVYL